MTLRPFRVHDPKYMPTNPQQPKLAADAVSVAAQEVKVVGENVHVEGQDETTKREDRAAVAGLAAEAVDVEDKKKATAIKAVADVATDQRAIDAKERQDIRNKDHSRLMTALILTAAPLLLTSIVTAFITYKDSIVNLSTHKLVNSGSLVQLKTNLRSARRIYMLTMDPDDKLDMDEAERLVEEHVAKQKLADEAGKGKP